MPQPYEAEFRPPSTDPPEIQPEAMPEVASGQWRTRKLLDRVAEHYTGEASSRFDSEIERKLFEQVVAGRNVVEKTTATDEVAAQGREATYGLFAMHAPLAEWLAVASTGAVKGKKGEPIIVKWRGNIGRLASPYAAIEDRTQWAFMGLLKAIHGYDPYRGEAKFSSYAGLAIFDAIEQGISHKYSMETCGPRVAKGILKAIGIACGVHQTADLFEAAKSLKGYPRVELEELAQWDQAQYHLSIDDIAYPYAAPEEIWDVSDEPPVLGVADTYPDTSQMNHSFEEYDLDRLTEEVRKALGTLEEYEAQLLREHYGLEGERPRTIEKVAKMLGKTPEQIRAVEKRVMQKLRDHSLAHLRSSFSESASDPWPHTVGGDNRLRTSRALSPGSTRANVVAVTTESRQPVKPVLPERESRGSGRYREIYDRFGVLLRGRNNLEQYQAEAHGTWRSPYPKALRNRIEEALGENLTPNHIADFWNSEFSNFTLSLEEALQDRFRLDRVTQLFSILLSSRMRETDEVKLNIPQKYEGVCNFLGAWAVKGKMLIMGSVGNYTGYGMHGTALLRVIGDVGDFSGHGMRDHAQLEIVGHVGQYAGRQASGHARVTVSGYAGSGAGDGIRGDAQVRDYTHTWRAKKYGPHNDRITS